MLRQFETVGQGGGGQPDWWYISAGTEDDKDKAERDTCFRLAFEVHGLTPSANGTLSKEDTELVAAWANLILAQRALARARQASAAKT